MKHLKTFLSISLVLLLLSCSSKKSSQISVAVFVPGIMADSPIYKMLGDGVQNAINEYNSQKEDNEKAKITIMEAGTNQAEWTAKITSLVATKNYDVIISSNPSLPDLVKPLTKQFPKQKFILLDAFLEGNENVSTVQYNQAEQSYVTGYIAGLMSYTHKIGLLAAQEYPVMNNVILPYYTKGAKDAYADTFVDFRIVGNWYDANKGFELSAAMYNSDCDVILPICGGASQGVISSAIENGFYITWFDNNGFEKAPEFIISSTVMKQDKMAKEVTTEFLLGNTQWGVAKSVGLVDGYIEFVQDNLHYINNVPEDIRKKVATVVSNIRMGKLKL